VCLDIAVRSGLRRDATTDLSNETFLQIIAAVDCAEGSTRARARAREGASHEENLSAESYQATAKTRISGTHEDPSGPRDFEAPTLEGSQAPGRHGRIQVGVSGRTGRFGPSDRILESRDFKRISREGRRTAAREFVLIVADSRSIEERRRIGVSVSRRVGNAVVRNHVKRRIREWFRRKREHLPNSTDVVVIARRGAAELDANQIAHALDALIGRAFRQTGPSQQ
jgi:ribonuclease P protein component